LAKAREQQKREAAKAEVTYGNVPSEDYLLLVLTARQPIELDSTMREDYELGVHEDGEFSISFNASCSTCGFRFMFERTEDTKA
jgi:hypothetical protein